MLVNTASSHSHMQSWVGFKLLKPFIFGVHSTALFTKVNK